MSKEEDEYIELCIQNMLKVEKEIAKRIAEGDMEAALAVLGRVTSGSTSRH